MSVGAIVTLVVVLVILAVVAALASRRLLGQSAERRKLGPEYTRLADEVGPRKANAEFDKRRRRVEGLGIKPLSPERRSQYSAQWTAVQERFIDSPAESVRNAAALITGAAADRGYQVADEKQFLVDLSVHHGNQLDSYRNSLAVTERADQAPTEELRRALLGYRGLFQELAEVRDDAAMATTATPAVAAAGRTPGSGRRVEKEEAAENSADPEGSGHGGRVFWRRETSDAAGGRP